MLSREEMLWFQALCRSTGIILIASTETQGGGEPMPAFHGRWQSEVGGERGAGSGLGLSFRIAGPNGGDRLIGVSFKYCFHVLFHELSPDFGRCFGVSTLRATKTIPTSSSFSGPGAPCFSSSDSIGTPTESEHGGLT